MEEMNGKFIGNNAKSLKVLIANSRDQGKDFLKKICFRCQFTGTSIFLMKNIYILRLKT